MATKITTRGNYGKTADEVLAAWADEGFYQAKGEAMGARNVSASTSDSGDSLSIEYSREEKSDVDVPGFAKKFVAEWNTVTQKDSWNKSARTGTTSVSISGTPVDVSGDMRLEESGDGCTLVIDWHIKSGIPLVGGKMEKLLAQDIESKSPRDEAATNAALG